MRKDNLQLQIGTRLGAARDLAHETDGGDAFRGRLAARGRAARHGRFQQGQLPVTPPEGLREGRGDRAGRAVGAGPRPPPSFLRLSLCPELSPCAGVGATAAGHKGRGHGSDHAGQPAGAGRQPCPLCPTFRTRAVGQAAGAQAPRLSLQSGGPREGRGGREKRTKGGREEPEGPRLMAGDQVCPAPPAARTPFPTSGARAGPPHCRGCCFQGNKNVFLATARRSSCPERERLPLAGGRHLQRPRSMAQ